MRRATFVLLGAVSAASACNLDLDESLIPSPEAGSDASLGGNAGASGSSGNSGTGALGGFGGAPTDAGPCDSDPQCAIENSCLEGKCVSGSCQYALCPAATACEGRACDFQANVCGEPKPLAFKLNQIAIPAEIGCGGSAQRCIAAAGDYVIVGTAPSSLLAWHVRNPLSPVPVALTQPPFAFSRLVSNGNRVLIIGVAAGTNLSLAWIDVPTGDVPADLESQDALVTFSGAGFAAYPADDDDFFFVENDAVQFFPTIRVDLPLTSGALTAQPSTGIPAGETIVAASGSRLLGYRTDTSGSQWLPVFSLETAAGTSTAQNGGEKPLTIEVPPSLGAHLFASAHDGSVLWSTNRVIRDDGSIYSDAVLLRLLIAAEGPIPDQLPEVVLETYPSYGTDTLRAGACAVVDAGTAIATAAYPADPSQTRVRGVLRAGAELTLGAGSDVVPFAPNALGIAATRHLGVVLSPSTATPPETPNTALRLYSPGCG